ncbi:MAG: penicillin-binding transpeptidase domain-containing protein [Bacteroidales bacterium]
MAGSLFIGILLQLSPGFGQSAVIPADFMHQDHHQGLQQLLDSAGVSGVILVVDVQSGILFSNQLQLGNQQHLPASTFKIPHSIIALETGVVQDENTLFEWDGQPRSLKVWERDMMLSEAFQRSCVPCYQQIASETGPERMKHWLELLGFGSMDVTPDNISTFWLEGHSRITPFQQLDFMIRFYRSQLPIKPSTTEIMKNMMVIEDHQQWRLSGKTGWAIRQNNNTGWFTGYLEKQGQVYFVVTCIEPDEKFDMKMFHLVRQQISMEAFRILKIIET